MGIKVGGVPLNPKPLRVEPRGFLMFALGLGACHEDWSRLAVITVLTQSDELLSLSSL